MENFPSSVLELTNYPANQPTKLGSFCWCFTSAESCEESKATTDP